MHCISIRRCAHVCGVNPMEDLVQPEMFHLLMGQAADPPMYVLTCIQGHRYIWLFHGDRFVYEDNALMAAAQSHQWMEAGVSLDHTVHAVELVVVEWDTEKGNAITQRKSPDIHAHVLVTQYLWSVSKIRISSNIHNIYLYSPEFGGSFCPGSAREYDPQLCNTNVSTFCDY